MWQPRKNKEEFVKNAIKIHGNKYSYDKFVYVNNKTKGIITCPIHGDFLMRPDKHLWQKRGCSKCNGGIKLSTEEFIRRAKEIHGDKYDYSKVVYENIHKEVLIGCPIHGFVPQSPVSHLNGHGCKYCGGSLPLNTELFVERSKQVHGNKYDYSKVEYTNNRTKVCIICPKHGEFWQTSEHHLNGVGCPFCNESHLERETSLYLDKLGIVHKRGKRFDWLGRQHLDFYLPKYNIAIECQGEQHYKPCTFGGITEDESINRFKYIQELDNRKSNLCEKNGLPIEYISYNEDVESKVNEILEKYGIRNDLGK